jgi:L-aminopeptidase/D-esterase-like protein
MLLPGPMNAITDVHGIEVGHYTDRNAVSGATVVVCRAGAIGAVDVRGAAPGTRETDLLQPHNLVEKVQAVVLAGGSVFGLAAADGVVRALAEQDIGFPLANGHVAPIVPAAVLYDLGRGPQFVPPISPEWGRAACKAAVSGPVASGSVGAGTGALAGTIKGGLGSASLVLESGITAAALVAVNPYGTVINPDTGRAWEIGLERGGEFGNAGRRAVQPPVPPGTQSGPATHTTIGVVATDALLTKAQAQKVAQMAHDGMARAIRPAHTMFDGDTIFCLATGKQKLPQVPGFFVATEAQSLSQLGDAAADCMARAIIRAVLTAESIGGMTAFCDLPDR